MASAAAESLLDEAKAIRRRSTIKRKEKPMDYLTSTPIFRAAIGTAGALLCTALMVAASLGPII